MQLVYSLYACWISLSLGDCKQEHFRLCQTKGWPTSCLPQNLKICFINRIYERKVIQVILIHSYFLMLYYNLFSSVYQGTKSSNCTVSQWCSLLEHSNANIRVVSLNLDHSWVCGMCFLRKLPFGNNLILFCQDNGMKWKVKCFDSDIHIWTMVQEAPTRPRYQFAQRQP